METSKSFRARVAALTGMRYRDLPVSYERNDALLPIVARRGDVYVVAQSRHEGPDGEVWGDFLRVVM